jgi:hypothetical protein
LFTYDEPLTKNSSLPKWGPDIRLHMPLGDGFSPSTVGWITLQQGIPHVTGEVGDAFVTVPLTSAKPCREWLGDEGITCSCPIWRES